MIFRYPIFGMPYYNRYSRYGYRYPYTYSGSTYSNYKEKNPNENVNPSFNNLKYNDNKNDDKYQSNSDSTESPLFQLFGIDLYFDDILLVCLILFLYQEGVKDESLFMALILLLFS